MKKKLFVIRKYVMATCAKSAIRLDKKTPVDECWIDEDFKKKSAENLTSVIGFKLSD